MDCARSVVSSPLGTDSAPPVVSPTGTSDAIAHDDHARTTTPFNLRVNVGETPVTHDDTSPLRVAAPLEHLDVVPGVLESQAVVDDSSDPPHASHIDTDAGDEDGLTPLHSACREGRVDVVTSLLAHSANTNATDEDGWTPLHYAATKGHVDVVSTLLARGAAVNAATKVGAAPIHYASSGGHVDVVFTLLTHGATMEVATEGGLTPLHYASRQGHADTVTSLLVYGAAVDAADAEGWTPLHHASSRGHVDVMIALLAHKAVVNAADMDGMTPFHQASHYGHAEAVALLLKQGISVDVTDADGWTSLHCAAQQDHVDVVTLLLASNASVNAADEDGTTPLHYASRRGHADVVTLLLDRGANVDSAAQSGMTPLHYASTEGHVGVVAMLLDRGATVDTITEGGLTSLHFASSQGRADLVSSLIEHGAALSAAGNDGWTALHFASNEGHLEVVASLLKHDAPASTADQDGRTPLHLASIDEHVDAVTLLLTHGATVDATDNDGRTSLHHASKRGYVDVMSTLLEHRASKQAADTNGLTALHFASDGGHVDAASLLLASGTNVDVATASGWSPLHFASSNGHVDVVSFLLENDATVDATDTSGWTSLHCASQQGHADVVSVLLAHDATVDALNQDGETSLHSASQQGRADIVKLLLKHGATVGAADTDGWTALHGAAKYGHLDVMTLLLGHGATVDVVKKDGSRPLHCASGQGHVDVVDSLLAHGATADATDMNGWTPLLHASYNGHVSVVLLLLVHNAAIDAVCAAGLTSLHYASHLHHADVVSTLLEHDATADVADNLGLTPLHYASARGHVQVVTTLLERGANVDAASKVGATSLHIASQEGLADVTFLLLKYGATADVKDDDGKTSLHYASRQGHVDVMAMLLNNDAASEDASNLGSLRNADLQDIGGAAKSLLPSHRCDVNAIDALGYTPLHFAVQDGYVDAVSILLANHANVDVASQSGATPLHVAAEHGQVDTVRLLLATRRTSAQSASDGPLHIKSYSTRCVDAGLSVIDASDIQGNTPLLTAARWGHFEVVEVLIHAGALASARAIGGETALIYAARRRDSNAISLLLQLGCLHPRGVDDTHASLLAVTLQTVRGYGKQMHEFEEMWMRVVDRLETAYEELKRDQDCTSESLSQFVLIVFHFIRLMPMCSESRIFDRLAASTNVASRLRDLHTELTFLERRASLKSFAGDSDSQCTSDEHALLERFREEIDTLVLMKSDEPEDSNDRVEAALLLQHSLRVHSDKYSEELLILLRLSLAKVTRSPSEDGEMSATPNWFIPPHELDFADVETSSQTGKVARGYWLSSVVVVSEHLIEREAFIDTVETWFPLGHPNVVKLFGASHFYSRFVTVSENVSSTNLRAFLARDETKHFLWQNLYEVALGLKYLIERRIPIRSLRCDHIWVGTDGVAKIGVLSLMTPHVGGSEGDRWQSLEVVRGAAPSMESSVYSLAMCALEAVSGEVPWAAVEASEILVYLDSLGRPDLPDTLTPAQKLLVQEMWSPILSNRPTISSVAQRLKHFAEAQSAEHNLREASRLLTRANNDQPLDLESYVFPESGSTIKDLLAKLEMKCQESSQDAAVLRILARLQDVYQLVKSHRLFARDVAITSYCELLESFDRFLGMHHFREKSVLQRAKSQQVTLEGNVFHRQLDELLELLAPPTVNPIHRWEEQQAEEQNDIYDATGEGTPAIRPVTIERFQTAKLNPKFTELDFAAIDAATAAGIPDANIEGARVRQLPWFIRMHELTKRSRIAAGAFGEVFKATWLGTPVVLKFMGYEADGDAYSHEMFFHELRVWFPLSHPHVIKLFGACHVGKRFFVCEFAGNGTLGAYLKREGNASRSWQLLYQVGLGLQHLHDQNVLHNDLKCDNVLIGEGDMAKLTDFGLSCILNSAEVKVEPKRQGALHWRSPEYLRGERLTLASDIYAFGMLVIEAVTGGPPWGQLVDFSVRLQVLRKRNLPLQPECFTSSQWSLVEMMCTSEPTQRVNISFVVDKLHDFWQQQASKAAAAMAEELAP